jgi:hypothetical protein
MPVGVMPSGHATDRRCNYMQSRRLILAPLVVLASALFVGAVIESGQQARNRSTSDHPLVVRDASIGAETNRVAGALQAETRCIGAFECGAAQRATRVRSEAAAIRRWPSDQRFAQARDALRTLLELRAKIIVQQSAMDLDGRRSARELDRLDVLQDRYHRAARSSIDSRHAVGLLDADEHAAALADWRDDR